MAVDSVFQRRADAEGIVLRWEALIRAGVLLFIVILPRSAAAACLQRPTVILDEKTAETHLLAKKDPVLPAMLPALVRVQKVVVLVTVDRKGVICEVKAIAGPYELQRAAAKTVKEHWRYRPFLVDWKPVVARFPVTVRFVLGNREPQSMAVRRGIGRTMVQGIRSQESEVSIMKNSG